MVPAWQQKLWTGTEGGLPAWPAMAQDRRTTNRRGNDPPMPGLARPAVTPDRAVEPKRRRAIYLGGISLLDKQLPEPDTDKRHYQ